jgi:hypothetical protein
MKKFFFNRPLFQTFFENLAKTLPQIFTAANIFSQPLLSSATEYSAIILAILYYTPPSHSPTLFL